MRISRILLVLLFGVFAAGTAMAVDYFRDLERCQSTDAKCVGRVLLSAILYGDDNGNTGGGNDDEVIRRVSFYHSDTCSSNLVAQVSFTRSYDDNVRKCRTLSDNLSTSIWGVQIYGQGCEDINDANFYTACISFLP